MRTRSLQHCLLHVRRRGKGVREGLQGSRAAHLGDRGLDVDRPRAAEKARTFLSDDGLVIYPGVTLAVYQVIETPESRPPIGLIDISLSLALDTVLLPIDLIVWPFGGWAAIWGDLFKVRGG